MLPPEPRHAHSQRPEQPKQGLRPSRGSAQSPLSAGAYRDARNSRGIQTRGDQPHHIRVECLPMISHRLLCLLISGGFLTFQLAHFVALRRFAARALGHLARRGKEAVEPTTDPADDWPAWVDEAARDADAAPTRDEAMAEMDDWLRLQPSLGWLQRAGVIAPLVGVVITVLGFWLTQPVVDTAAGGSALPAIF